MRRIPEPHKANPIVGITTIFEFEDGTFDVKCSERAEDGGLVMRWEEQELDAVRVAGEVEEYLKLRARET